MAENSKIEWTDHTFNPWVGCTKISPGCDHCYAETWAKRSGSVEWGGPRRRTSVANWKQPRKWDCEAMHAGRRYRVFCASLADVFDNEVDPRWRFDLFNMIRHTPHLDWLLLTKRIGNATNMIVDVTAPELRYLLPLPNVWIGATVVNQEEADRDIPKLLATPAAVRFLSCEPLLGPITLRSWLDLIQHPQLPGKIVKRLDWIIAGGESGHHARPMHPDWARSLRDQCVAASVPFLFKQWGEWAEVDGDKPTRTLYSDQASYRSQASRCKAFISYTGHWLLDLRSAPPDIAYRGLVRPGKSAAGRQLDGRTWDEFPRAT